MDRISEQPKIEIRSTIEQKPFENPAVRSFFKEWCKTNDSIQPRLIPRNEWEVISAGGILRKRPDGNQVLIIPNDLQLWEMVGIMEAVDQDTFKNKPERQTQKKEEIISLGKMLQNTGIYISQRLGAIEEGKPIARALAEELYAYGQSLVEGKSPPEQEQSAQNLSSQPITATEVEEVDRFLAGEQLYRSRQERAEKVASSDPLAKKEIYEEERRKTLRQFFRATQKAFALKTKSESGQLAPAKTDLMPWQSDAPIHQAFLAKVERAITQEIETPKRELDMAIFRRGLQSLVDEMKERGWKHAVNSLFNKLGINLELKQRRIAEILDIDQLKTELEEARRSGNRFEASLKEREIASKIQRAVSRFPYREYTYSPTQMLANRYVNCVGASTLGGALMKKAGLNYLVGDVPEHSITVLITADGKIYWYDMQGTLPKEIKDSDLRALNNNDALLKVSDIVSFSKSPNREGLIMEIPSFWYRFNLGQLRKFPNPFLAVSPPEYGQQVQILNSTGVALLNLNQSKEAIEAFRRAIPARPKEFYSYNNLGHALSVVGQHKEALEVLREAVAINPKHATPYFNLGDAFSGLGRNKEAIEAYRKSIELADKKNNKNLIKEAKKKIAKLQKR